MRKVKSAVCARKIIIERMETVMKYIDLQQSRDARDI